MSPSTTIHHPNEILTSIIGSLRKASVTEATVPNQTHARTQESSFGSLLAKLETKQQIQVKNVFLTLHFLFPHELLPALDLLDRRLVRSLYSTIPLSEGNVACSTTESDLDTNISDHEQDNGSGGGKSIIPSKHYYVQSASAAIHGSSTSSSIGSTSRYRNVYNTAGTYYEVHLDSWNCTCPAFAFSSMKLLMSRGDESERQISIEGNQTFNVHFRRGDHEGTTTDGHMDDTREGDREQECRFGGIATQADTIVPICKHILAVVLAHGAPGLFDNSASSVEGCREEIAGRAAGYGTG